jgi:hypothetical protein
VSSETTSDLAGHGDVEHTAPGDAHGAVEHGAVSHGAVDHADLDHEQPSDWGWNAEMGNWASRAGWIVVVILCLMFAGVTHYNKAGFLAQLLAILGLIAVLIWDRQRKRTSWRD